MSIKTKIAAAALAALAVTGSIVSTTSSAEAKQPGWVWGVGAGIATAAVVGSAIAASNDPYYTAITAAAGSPSTTPSASTSAAFVPATDLGI
ncbi:2-methylcitrate dehydratase PrpD [Bradyrhizobium liaoningense]|nr:hypothetical protein GCM10007858_38230 [Bradyrhizobium liaoningense]